MNLPIGETVFRFVAMFGFPIQLLRMPRSVVTTVIDGKTRFAIVHAASFLILPAHVAAEAATQ